jgi:CheY-like chemotaxis protein
VKLECSVARDLPHALLLDRIRLRQVLVNLVGNAVKFTDKGNIFVRVLWEKQDSSSHITLLIEVQDTGVGIPQDKLEAIFKPFVQAGTDREKEKSGTGLGLAIVKRLSEKMGGTVTAASVIGQGSAFSLRFPDVAISARLPEGEKLERGEPADFNDLRPATLLVVDDNETNCLLVAGMFTGSHHRLLFAANGSEAVTKTQDAKPDVILLDIRMPGMDGREALAAIRSIPGAELTPVIAVTASSLMGEERELKERFSGYVRKPFSKRELFDELAHFLPPQTTSAQTSQSAPTSLLVHPPSELIAELRRLERDEWPAIRDSLAVNETKAFAGALDDMGQRWDCQPLLVYAQTLLRHAENYSIVEMEKHVREFNNLVQRLEQSSSA